MKKAAVISIVAIGAFFLVINLFKVQSFSCTQTEGFACPSKLIDKLNNLKGSSMIKVWRSLGKTLETTPYIESYSYSLSSLNSISLRVTLRKPDIALKSEGSELYSLYTKDGVFVDEVAEVHVPILIIKEQLTANQIPFVVMLSYELTKTLSVNNMTITGSSIRVVISDGRTLYYPMEGDIDVLLGATVLTFSQLNQSDGKLIIKDGPSRINEIDFRFKNPVLR